MGLEESVRLGGCEISILCMVTVPHKMVGLENMLDYRGVGLERFHCTYVHTYVLIMCSIVPGLTQLVRLVRFWSDQYFEVTSKIYFGLLREGSSFEESTTASSII